MSKGCIDEMPKVEHTCMLDCSLFSAGDDVVIVYVIGGKGIPRGTRAQDCGHKQSMKLYFIKKYTSKLYATKTEDYLH